MSVSGFTLGVGGEDWVVRLRQGLGANPNRDEARLLIAFASPQIPLDEVAEVCRTAHPEAVLFGCSSAGEFTEDGETKGSLSILVLSGDMVVSSGLGKGLKADPEACVTQACSELHSALDTQLHHTALMVADGLAFVGEEAALLAAMCLGPQVTVGGASAADDLMLRETRVLVDGETSNDAVGIVLISSSTAVSLGVAHGHTPLGRSGLVTASQGNVVHEIDGQPAWEAYFEATQDRASQQGLTDSDLDDPTAFVKYMASFEAGLKIDTGYKVRAALSRNPDQSLNFVCQMPEGTRLEYMGSSAQHQISSASRAAEMARQGLQGAPAAGVLVFECACRKVILGDRFNEAVVD